MIKVFKDSFELSSYSSAFNFTAVVAFTGFQSVAIPYQNITYVGNFRYYGVLETYHGAADKNKISKFYMRNP